MSQALDLAAGYKEKSETVQKQMDLVKKTTDEQLSEANSQLLSLNKVKEVMLEENKHLSDQLDECKKTINEVSIFLT